MIREQLAVDEMRPADAYVQGWQDHADSLGLAADNEAALAATRAARHLDTLLDRVWNIAPWNPPPAEPAAEEEVVVEARVFDWEER